MRLEVVSDADHRIVDVVVAVGIEFRGAGQPEAGHLADDASVFGANIEAGADLVGDAAAVKANDRRLALGVQCLSSKVANGAPEQSAAAGLQKRVQLMEVEVVH